MPTYAVALTDATEVVIVPGYRGGIYESESAIPIPHRGDIILSMDRRWIVERLIYQYESDEKHELVCRVTIQCSPLQE